MRKNYKVFFCLMCLSVYCNAQQVGCTFTGDDITFEADKLVVISPEGDTISDVDQQVYLGSGIYKPTVKFKDGCMTIKLDSTHLSKMLGSKLSFNIEEIAERNGLMFNRDYPTIINLWNTTCKPCIEELPTLNKLCKEYPNFNYLAITGSSDSLVNYFLAKNVFSYSVIAERVDLIQSFKNNAFPIHIFVDQNMEIKKIIAKGIDENDTELIKWFYSNTF